MKYEVFHLCERSEQYEWNECKLELSICNKELNMYKGNKYIQIKELTRFEIWSECKIDIHFNKLYKQIEIQLRLYIKDNNTLSFTQGNKFYLTFYILLWWIYHLCY